MTTNPDDAVLQGSFIRATIPVAAGGSGSSARIYQMAVPGYEIDQTGNLTMDFPSCQCAIRKLPDLGICHYVCLMPDDEIGRDETQEILEMVTDAGITAHHLPICDYAKPDPAFLAKWAVVSPILHACLDRGKTVVLQCLAGYGRSGTIAALLLIERGLSADDAIAEVRTINPESIESDAQRCFLIERAAHASR
ncbi:hypothetical protein LPB41_02650 [Thalassospira sp. MA62]|nr:hypothetical protein [Thalassospira sp. MA62]